MASQTCIFGQESELASMAVKSGLFEWLMDRVGSVCATFGNTTPDQCYDQRRNDSAFGLGKQLL